MTRQARDEVPLHVGPFGGKDAEHHAVANGAVAASLMMAKHAVLLGADPGDRALRRKVEVVGSQPHDLTVQRLERVRQEQQLARRVDVAALPLRPVPGVADLDAIDLRHDVVVPRAADDRVGRQLADGPWEHVAGLLAVQRVGNVGRGLVGPRDGREPELPEAPVGCGGRQATLMLGSQRLESNPVAFERDWLQCDHEDSGVRRV